MFNLPPLLLKPSIPKKMIHLAGVVLLWPLLSIDRLHLLILLAAVILLVWSAIRFVAYGLIGEWALLLLFTPDVASIAWTTLIAGDGAAAVGGLLWGKDRLPWNTHKSFQGSIAFIGASFVGVYVLLSATFRIPASTSLALAIAVSLLGGLTESLPLRINDNLSVTLVSGVVFRIMLSITK